MSLTVTVEFPALDRLCAWLEGREKAELLDAIETEIIAKIAEAARSGVPKPEFKEVEPADDHPWKDEAKGTGGTKGTGNREQGTGNREQGTGNREQGTGKEAAAPEPEQPSTVTLADVQQACARLRDAGKMNEVKALFPEFGIKKLSDLKSAERLAAFAARLKKLEG